MKYVCTEASCRCEATFDEEARPRRVDYFYPRDRGPLSENYRQHDCPMLKGLWPPAIDHHPLARKVG